MKYSMVTEKQRKWRKKFAALYGKKKKKKKSKNRSPKVKKSRRSVTMPRKSRKQKQKRSHKKYITLSLMDIAHLSVQYSNLTNTDLGSIIDQLVKGFSEGNFDFLEMILNQVSLAIDNVIKNPFSVAIKGMLIAFVFSQLKAAVGRKKLIQVGKFRITT